jgi:hypothetical protein
MNRSAKLSASEPQRERGERWGRRGELENGDAFVFL